MIEGEAAKVTNGVARIGAKTGGLTADIEPMRQRSRLRPSLEETNRPTVHHFAPRNHSRLA
jgi:hypothetical protein